MFSGKRVRFDECTDNPHANTTAKCAVDEQVTATEAVDEIEQPEKGNNSLYDAVKARGEKRAVCSL